MSNFVCEVEELEKYWFKGSKFVLEANISGEAMKLYLRIRNMYSEDANTKNYPATAKAFAFYFGISESSVNRYVKELKEVGLMEVHITKKQGKTESVYYKCLAFPRIQFIDGYTDKMRKHIIKINELFSHTVKSDSLSNTNSNLNSNSKIKSENQICNSDVKIKSDSPFIIDTSIRDISIKEDIIKEENIKENNNRKDDKFLFSLFSDFYDLYPTKSRPIDKEFLHLKKTYPKTWREIVPILSENLDRQIKEREAYFEATGKEYFAPFKYMQGFITDARWNDKPIVIPNVTNTSQSNDYIDLDPEKHKVSATPTWLIKHRADYRLTNLLDGSLLIFFLHGKLRHALKEFLRPNSDNDMQKLYAVTALQEGYELTKDNFMDYFKCDGVDINNYTFYVP